MTRISSFYDEILYTFLEPLTVIRNYEKFLLTSYEKNSILCETVPPCFEGRFRLFNHTTLDFMMKSLVQSQVFNMLDMLYDWYSIILIFTVENKVPSGWCTSMLSLMMGIYLLMFVNDLLMVGIDFWKWGSTT